MTTSRNTLNETENNIDFLGGVACHCGPNGAESPPCESCQAAQDLKTAFDNYEEVLDSSTALLDELDLTGWASPKGPNASELRRALSLFPRPFVNVRATNQRGVVDEAIND